MKHPAPLQLIIVLTALFVAAFSPSPSLGNEPPACDLGDDITVTAQGDLTTVPIVPEPGAVSDPDGDSITYLWSLPEESMAEIIGPDNASAFLGRFPVGDTVVSLTVSDGEASSSCEVTVSVVLPAPPVIACKVDPDVLWPPNHKMREVTIMAPASSVAVDSPAGLLVTCRVTSDEPDGGGHPGNRPIEPPGNRPDELPNGEANRNVPGDRGGDVNGSDGHTAPVEVELEYDETAGAFVGTLHLRAERLGQGDGREYVVTCKVEDPFGQTAEDTCTVLVPHDQGRGAAEMVKAKLEAKKARQAKKRAKKKARWKTRKKKLRKKRRGRS